MGSSSPADPRGPPMTRLVRREKGARALHCAAAEGLLGPGGYHMDLQLTGLRAIVTAGAGGIGLEIVRALRVEGACVVLCDVDDAALDAVRAEAPDVTALRCDVADAGRRRFRQPRDRYAGRAGPAG